MKNKTMKISEQIFPRQVALICSTDGKKDNVMTASFLMPVSFEPKYLAVSISPQRYTFSNLKKIPEITLNVLDEKMERIAKICGTLSGKEADKFEIANLKKEKSKRVKPPLIKNCPISFECEIESIEKAGDHYLILARVVREIIRKKDFKPLLHKTRDIFPKIK
jgi:flavin reductase (DIM6/NTAB) family NADH-FMN oxidoreductase RutF